MHKNQNTPVGKLMKRRTEALVEAQAVVDGAKASDRDITPSEQARVDGLLGEVKQIDAEIAGIREAAAKSRATIADLTAGGDTAVPADWDWVGPDARTAPLGKAGEASWGRAVAAQLKGAAGRVGVKALLQGEVMTPPPVPVTPLPDKPRRLLDLVYRTPMEAHTYSYLRQVARENQAAVVPDGALKPTSLYEFREVNGRARVVAHLSEPFPLRYMSDYEGLAQVLDSEMKAGVLEAVEAQILSGDGIGENMTGILNTSGVLQVPYGADLLSTVRSARVRLDAIGENPTAWVLNPDDAAELELTRENGSTGAFLMGGGAYDVIFGQGVSRVTSARLPRGTAILADWSMCALRVRESESTLAATQAGDLFDTNRVKLRSEGRYDFDVIRPQAFAVVDLSAAP